MASEERAAPILALVRGLVGEVYPHATPPSVTLDSTFDNLGIGSLELAELLLRVQDKFGVHHFPRRGAVDITVGEPIWPRAPSGLRQSNCSAPCGTPS